MVCVVEKIITPNKGVKQLHSVTNYGTRSKKLKISIISGNTEKYIKWMCYNLLISVDNQVFNLSMKPLKEQLIGGSYCFYCKGRYRTKKWIRERSANVLGCVTK